jgi:DNA-binding NarL/FixJ family response regulator
MTQDRIAGYNAGADAYLPKPFDPDELVAIVDGVIERHETLNGANVQVDDLKRDLDEIKYLLLEKGGGGVGNGWVEQTNIFLAPDEREILELLCQGLMTKEIAARTYLSTRRVEQLLTRMFRKTGVKNRTELVRWAVATGNVQL